MRPPLPIRTRRGAAGCFAVIMAAVAAPMVNLWRAKPRDSFPLSHYPMFSHQRGTHMEVTFLRGVLVDGGHRPLDSRLGATGGMNQERKQIDRAARRGRGDRLARKAARRIARREILEDVVAVEVVVGQFPLADYFADGPVVPDEARIAGHHPVPGRGPA